jgi:hypothetical protein
MAYFKGHISSAKSSWVGKFSKSWDAYAELLGPNSTECKELHVLINVSLDYNKTGISPFDLATITRATTQKYLGSNKRPEYWYSESSPKVTFELCPCPDSVAFRLYEMVTKRETEITADDEWSNSQADRVILDQDYRYRVDTLNDPMDTDFVTSTEVLSWREHVRTFKDYCRVSSRPSLEDSADPRVSYSGLTRKYIAIFLQRADELYREKKNTSAALWDEQQDRFYSSWAHRKVAEAVYYVTYTEAKSWFGLSFCWRVCGHELNAMKRDKVADQQRGTAGSSQHRGDDRLVLQSEVEMYLLTARRKPVA